MTPPVLVAVDPRRDDAAALALGLRLARVAGAPLVLAAACPTQGADFDHDAPRHQAGEAQLRHGLDAAAVRGPARHRG
jgi:hypothetical protein